jgi:hypothetical protein
MCRLGKRNYKNMYSLSHNKCDNSVNKYDSPVMRRTLMMHRTMAVYLLCLRLGP